MSSQPDRRRSARGGLLDRPGARRIGRAIGRLVPPVAAQLAESVARRVGLLGPPEFVYLRDGRGLEAGHGWEDPSLVARQRSNWTELVRRLSDTAPLGLASEARDQARPDCSVHNTLMTFGYVAALAARNQDELSLLDWGGGLGLYRLIAGALLPDVRVGYWCKELPLLCRAGRDLVPDATFVDSDDECFSRSYDLVMASGSLQFAGDWRRMVARFASVARRYVYITRLPLVRRSESFRVLQRPYRYGYDTEYACWFINRDDFLGSAAEAGLELEREFLVDEAAPVKGAPEQAEFRGFLFRPADSGIARR